MELFVPLSPFLRAPFPKQHSEPSSHPHTNRFPKAKQHSTNFHQRFSGGGLHHLPVLTNAAPQRKFFLSTPTSYDTSRIRGRSDSPVVCAQLDGAALSDDIFKRTIDFLDACWRFMRPHTIRGIIFASFSWAARAFIENPHGQPLELSLVLKALSGLFALVCANGYIVGINQIYDIGIDKVNKPYLPIAAGDFTVPTAWTLCISFASAGIVAVVANKSEPLVVYLYGLSLFLGSLYSVPPFRMKRFAAVGYMIIASVRGFVLNFGIYCALKATVRFPFRWTTPMKFITTFVTLFAFVIGITKDLPDVEGDRKYNIATFAAKLGVRNMAFLGSGLLLLNYIAAVAAAIAVPQSFRAVPMIPAHVVLALSLVFQAWLLEKANYTKQACVQFYQFIWYLFYSEYILFPFI